MFFFINTSLKSLNYAIHQSSPFTMLCNERQTSCFGSTGDHVFNWCLTRSILHYAPYSIVNWIKIRSGRKS